MRLTGLLDLYRQRDRYRMLFGRAMRLARRYKAERDAARHEVSVLENSDALEVAALESRVRMLERELDAARKQAEQAQARFRPTRYVRVVVVLDKIRGTVHSITSDQDEAQRHVRELIAKAGGDNLAATMTAWAVDVPPAAAVPSSGDECTCDLNTRQVCANCQPEASGGQDTAADERPMRRRASSEQGEVAP